MGIAIFSCSHMQSQERIFEYFFYPCSSLPRMTALGFLYGYKALLQISSVWFAFQIHKVKVKGLNDAIFIVAAVYVTSIMLIIIMVSTYLLEKDYINVYPATYSLGLLVGATAILALVFIPKVISHC